MSTEADAGRKRLALTAAIMGSFVASLDATVVNVAPPAIERDLGGGLPAQQWVVNGYVLALGSLILVGGSLGDVFGERRIFGLGVAGFGFASAACAGRARRPVFALIRQPDAGWGSAQVLLPLIAGLVLLGAFLLREARTAHPMLPLGLFARRNFAIANLQTSAMYAGLAVQSFFSCSSCRRWRVIRHFRLGWRRCR